MSAILDVTRSSVSILEPRQAAKRPRLLYLITRAEHGGAQTHVLDLALGVRDRYDVEIATGEEGFLTNACRRHGIPVHVVPYLEREIKPLSDLRGLSELIGLMRYVEPDLVHAHTFKAGFLGRLAASYLKIASLYTVHMWPFGRAVPLSWRLVAPCVSVSPPVIASVLSASPNWAPLATQNKICDFSQIVSILNGIPDHPARARLDREKI